MTLWLDMYVDIITDRDTKQFKSWLPEIFNLWAAFYKVSWSGRIISLGLGQEYKNSKQKSLAKQVLKSPYFCYLTYKYLF